MPLLRLGPLSLPSPVEVLDAGRGVAAWAGEVVTVGAALPSRVDGLLDEVGRLLGALGDLAERADALVGRAEGIVGEIGGVIVTSRRITTGTQEVVDASRSITGGAEEVVASSRSITSGARQVVEGARRITDGASAVVDGAGSTSRAAQELIDLYRPMLERAAPLTGRFVEELSPEEIDAAIKLVDQLPPLTEHMTTDIMPILETLDRVGPDISELLSVTKELRQALSGIPGLSLLTRRGAAKEEDDRG